MPRSGTVATYAFEIGYLADGFQGYARQPGARTIEGVLRAGLRRRGLIDEEGERRFRSASRTDRGVHALGNVISFPTRLPGARAARALGALDPAIFCFGWTDVPEGFEPRHARQRWYRYVEPASGHRAEVWQAGARHFEGEHDFGVFARRDEPPRATRLRVDEIHVEEVAGVLRVDVRAPRFLWNQVRKMISALRWLDEGRLTSAELDQALQGARRLSLPPAPPERLILMQVAYDRPFQRDGLPSAGVRAALMEERGAARDRLELLDMFVARSTSAPAPRAGPPVPLAARPSRAEGPSGGGTT